MDGWCSGVVTHHTCSLDGLRKVPCVRFTPEHVTLELLCAAVHDHREGVAVVSDAQEGEETYLTIPERLLPFLSGSNQRGRNRVKTSNVTHKVWKKLRMMLPVPSTETGCCQWRGRRSAPTRLCLLSSWCSLSLGSAPPYLHKHSRLEKWFFFCLHHSYL